MVSKDYPMRYLIFCLIAGLMLSAPVDARMTVVPGVGVGAEYTDNVYLDEKKTETDIITYVSPELTMDIRHAERSMQLYFSPSFRNYVKGTETSKTQYDAYGSVSLPISRNVVFQCTDTFLLSDDPTKDTEDRSIRKKREKYYRNTASTRITSQFGNMDTLFVGCEYAVLENDDPELEDTYQVTPAVGFVYRLSPDWSLSMNADYAFGHYSGPSDGQLSDDFESMTAMVKISRQLNHFMDLFLQYTHTDMHYRGQEPDYIVMEPAAGVSLLVDQEPIFSIIVGYYTWDRSDRDNESGLTLTGNIGKQFRFQRGSFGMNFTSGYEESDFGAENLGFNLYHQAAVTCQYNFSKTLSGDVMATLRDDNYKNLDYRRNDVVGQVKTSLSYSVKAWMDLRLSYAYRRVDSYSILDEGYEENRVTVEIFMASNRFKDQSR